jgi:hypothetical protein
MKAHRTASRLEFYRPRSIASEQVLELERELLSVEQIQMVLESYRHLRAVRVAGQCAVPAKSIVDIPVSGLTV